MGLYLVVAYLNQGVAQHFCLIAQPLDNYLLKAQGFNAAQVAAFLSFLMLPWLIKPLYGLASDFMPIGRKHHKPYLLIGTAFGAVSYALAAVNPQHPLLLTYLLCASFGMALSTVVLVALVAKEARGNSKSIRTYFAIQATAYYLALILCGIAGGLLCENLSAAHAMQVAACICACFCFLAFLATLKLSDDQARHKSSFARYRKLIVSTIAARKFQAVAAFVFLWNLSPSFGTPLYFYYTKTLHFQQDVIGRLLAINSIGMLFGSLLFHFLTRYVSSPRKQAIVAVLAGVVTNLLYVFCVNVLTASCLDLMRGVSQMLAILTIYGLAADVCPRKIAATGLGVLIAINNTAMQLGALAGASFFTSFCQGAIQPLALITALTAMMPLICVRFLPHRNR